MVKGIKFFAAAVLAVGISGAVGCKKSEEPMMKAVDPICKMEVKIEEGAIQAEHEGHSFYFCAEHCKEVFLKDPGKYAGASRSFPAGLSGNI